MSTIYLWSATQSEPGCDGIRYAATLTADAPARNKPVRAYPGLVYEESLYDDWTLIGTTKGALVEGILPGLPQIKSSNGFCWDIDEIVRGGRYRKVRVAA